MKQRITELIKSAMINKDQVTLGILRVLKGEIERAEQDPKKGKIEVPDSKIYSIINSLLEVVRESEDERNVLISLLPTQLTEEETKSIIDKLISENDLVSKGMSGMGVVMKVFNENYAGRFDNKIVTTYTRVQLL